MGDAPILKLYNTLMREKIDFKPINEENVRMYVCGPTVYDFAHIGNARPVIVFDVLYRLLRHIYGENHVTYVRNITDVDDKINARALRDFGPEIAAGTLSLNDAIRHVTEKTEKQFQDDAAALCCLPPTHQPRATDNIVQMIAMIGSLLDRGHAYISTGSEGREVLFSVPSMKDYGQLSKRRLEDQQAGARIAVEAHKRHPGDFVLWKESAENEPGWHAEFSFDGKKQAIFGRPGWHIECSAMSDRYLWEEMKDKLSPNGRAKPHQFDIHGGGLDLIFPHHENEIAQSCCATGHDVMANVWMHNGFLQVEGKKMSKSEGNFVTISELLHTDKFGGKKWPGEVLRLAMLMTHYREPIDFSVKRLEEAANIAMSFYNTIIGHVPKDGVVIPEVMNSLLDDLNTPMAIQAIQRSSAPRRDLAASIYFLGLENQRIATISREGHAAQSASRKVSIERAFKQMELNEHGISEEELNLQIDTRLELLKAKNFAEADEIRNELLKQGIQLKDGKDPVTGERVTTWEVKR